MNSEAVMMIVNMLLEDVAENPQRLSRAQEIARRDMLPFLENNDVLTSLEQRIVEAARQYVGIYKGWIECKDSGGALNAAFQNLIGAVEAERTA